MRVPILIVIIMSRLNPVLGCALELHAVLLDIIITPQANVLSVFNSGVHTPDPSSVLHQDIDIARLHMYCKKKIMGSRYSVYFTTTLHSTSQIVKREWGGE